MAAIIETAAEADPTPQIEWDKLPVDLPRCLKGQSWWLCTANCTEFKRDPYTGEPKHFVTPTANVARLSQTHFSRGKVYAATETELPSEVRKIPKTRMQDGIEIPVFMDDPSNPNPYAPKIAVFETETDAWTGDVRILTERVGVNHFRKLPNAAALAEEIVRDFRAGNQIEAGALDVDPHEAAQERAEDLNRIGETGHSRAVSHIGPYRTSIDDYEDADRAPAAPGAPPAGESVVTQLADELGLSEDLMKRVLQKGMEAVAAEPEPAAGQPAEEVASQEETKPWEAQGISRATYFRRQREAKEAAQAAEAATQAEAGQLEAGQPEADQPAAEQSEQPAEAVAS